MKKILFTVGLVASLVALDFDNFDSEFDSFMNGKPKNEKKVEVENTQNNQQTIENIQEVDEEGTQTTEEKIEQKQNLETKNTQKNIIQKSIYKKPHYNNIYYVDGIESPVQFDYTFDTKGNLKSLKFSITMQERNNGHYLDYQKYYEKAAFSNFLALTKLTSQNEPDLDEFKSELSKYSKEPDAALNKLQTQLKLVVKTISSYDNGSSSYGKVLKQTLKEIGEKRLFISLELKDELIEKINQMSDNEANK